ncbi:hypothetical protein A3K86_22165 [Photobacterium jeanii]|uniref:Uncharacterized protein n=1 Tax=Photobacterium jeanii TaxID=858640 RepID=A0A178K4K4_9GAMM|nr:hypothetical protein [Photobacterium jeanii]OAN11623.1 hypothetical protein A3K86_22165 [Photobacterium jeanii]PST91144.1 hypothetical protein C9I91_11270 [Photobacterium jeanii]
MKKAILILAGIGVFAYLATNTRQAEPTPVNEPLPQAPSFVVSTAFDGEWQGKRLDISGDNVCQQTRILGTITDGEVKFKLMYNNTVLKGWISESGELDLYADSVRWGYRFTGNGEVQANSDAALIKGDWHVTNAPCHGSWQIERVTQSPSDNSDEQEIA